MNDKEDINGRFCATAWTVALFSFLITYNDPAWKAIGVVVSIIAFIIGILYFIASVIHHDRS